MHNEETPTQSTRPTGLFRKIASVAVAVSSVVATAGTSANAAIQNLIDTAQIQLSQTIQTDAPAVPDALVLQPSIDASILMQHGSHASHASHASHCSHFSGS